MLPSKRQPTYLNRIPTCYTTPVKPENRTFSSSVIVQYSWAVELHLLKQRAIINNLKKQPETGLDLTHTTSSPSDGGKWKFWVQVFSIDGVQYANSK